MSLIILSIVIGIAIPFVARGITNEIFSFFKDISSVEKKK